MSTVIKVENLSKLYRLGVVGTGTLSHDLNRWWHQVRGKEDPYLKIGEENDRTAKGGDYSWALRDIDFEVKQGEVMGIIGKNGAGKSTLLKILSRVTQPTTGAVKVKGRIASLLEVGTGFHPELTGRENIFLNGAILGMTKAEIRSKFDEIVDFSGVERYIDTPVKRYSSGMYVRLAFAVAAHLEPEILIVDEVLAVGDMEFQKKCLGKMQSVAGEGRTVLFVSHNMPAVKSLCNQGLLLRNGLIIHTGPVENIVEKYFQEESLFLSTGIFLFNDKKNLTLSLKSVKTKNSNNKIKGGFNNNEDVLIEFDFNILKNISGVRIGLKLVTAEEFCVFVTHSHHLTGEMMKPGDYNIELKIPRNILNEGRYGLIVFAGVPGQEVIYPPKKVLTLDIINTTTQSTFSERSQGILSPALEWKLNNVK